MTSTQQRTADRLADISAELKIICDQAIRDAREEAEVRSLGNVLPFQKSLEELAAKEVTPHEKLFLHLADEEVTDAEALLAFRRRLQDVHYSEYADTLSVLRLLSDLSNTRLAFLQHWEQREQEEGRSLNVDKEWLDYRLLHAKAHSEGIRLQIIAAEESDRVRFRPEDVSA